MTTPISTSIAYATPADIREAHDFRQGGDFVNDDGTRMTDSAAFDALPKVNRCLMIASGMVEASCLRGNRYTVQDLQGLQGASKYLLIDIVVELAWWKLTGRRLSGKPMPPEALYAFSMLESLEKGEKIFGLQEQANAGNPSNGFMTSEDWKTLNLASDQARRFFGRRSKYGVNGSDGCSDPCGCD